MTTETKRGTVSRTFFVNHDGPAMAGTMDLEDGGSIRFSGKCAANVGDKLELVGAWGNHPTYGEQFVAETGQVQMDESPDSLVHLLASHKDFKGLGPVRARKVVDAAMALSNDGTVSKSLEDFPQEIADASGVSLEIVENAAEVWGGRRNYFNALALLGEQGWSGGQATRIVARFGEGAPAMVEADPYFLIGKLERFGFRTVDTVALNMGVNSCDKNRLITGVAYCLTKIADDGNTWTTREGLTHTALDELRPDTLDGEDMVNGIIDELIQLGLIHLDKSPLGAEIVSDANLVRIESEVFDMLMAGITDDTVEPFNLSGPLSSGIVETLNDGQRAAMAGFSSRLFAVVSGGAGVGKTYTMRAICEAAKENGIRVSLCAPTGKAARKLAHATGREALTIHRLLECAIDEDTGRFRFTRNPNRPLEAGLIVVDEVSMVDVELMHSLLLALKGGARMLLVGDHHQIPSVGPGAILRDLLAAQGRYPAAVHVLTEIVRQAGVLARNTTSVLDGVVVPDGCPSWGICNIERGHEIGAAAIVSELVESVVMAPASLQPFGRPIDFSWDVQVLAPMRKGPLGTYALNVELQKLRQRLLGNPPPPATKEDMRPKPLPGDRVICTKNDYELDIMNGSQAVVMRLVKGGALELFTEDGREVTIPPGKRDRFEVAYAITIHKSQGSEWPWVILCAANSHRYMHDRHLFYTGASRAAESLTIVGDTAGMRNFARENKSSRRQTLGGFMVHGWRPTTRSAPAPLAPQADA